MTRTLALSALGLLIGCSNGSGLSAYTTDDAIEPELRVVEPAPGAHIAPGTATVAGEASDLHDITVNGVAASVEGDTFTAEVPVERGMNHFEVRGLSPSGYEFFDRRGVLAGDFSDASGFVEDAMGIRVNQGGLDAIVDMARDFIDVEALGSELDAVNPVYEDAYGLFGWDAVVVSADVGQLYFAEPELALVPGATVLQAEVVLPDLLVTVPVEGEVIGIDFDVTATLEADAAVVTGALEIGIDDRTGDLTVDMIAPQVQLMGFFFDTSMLPGEIEDWLLSDTVRGAVEDMLVEQLDVLVPELIDQQLDSLDLSMDLELLDKTMALELAFAEATVDRDGLLLVADLDLSMAGGATKSAPGVLATGATDPRPAKGADVAMDLSDDLLNRLLFEAWRGGLLDLELSSDDGSLDPALVAGFGARGSAALVVDAGMPPVLVQKGDDVFLQAGELDLTLLTPGGEKGDRLEATAFLEVPIDVEVQGGALTIGLGAADASYVVRDSDWGAQNETITRLLEESLDIGVLLLLMGDLEFPLPTIGDIVLPDASVDRDSSGMWTRVQMDL